MIAFLDTNVLVYRIDRQAPAKQARAAKLLDTLYLAGDALLSTQVLQEYYHTATGKFRLPPASVALAAQAYARARLVQVTPSLIYAAMARHARRQFSFWDALIVEAALSGGAKILYSEDMGDGEEVDGLVIRNPFRNA